MDFPKDEKLSRKVLGLAASGSDYLCTYCTASRSDAAEHPIVGNYGVTLTNRLLREAASYLQVNPEKKSQSQLAKYSHGVKQMPLTSTEPCNEKHVCILILI